ncbi:O-antigen/teichoic acid export membrane protein [Pseudomonas duriflava]|uniref:O-antigen/teichoic acid export membrane protein n=1 Tax=Pseudomonas duriflava TaxID=459528 RepID=A0A562PS65_9PSED|nr:oligosaccharide flippase family protein [Pseudomonas duriflava]TWI47277.1 O-antigen/teichoic acid export membrane protein [Pseudomonas duriflava]
MQTGPTTLPRASLLRNTVLNYLGQAYGMLIGILIMPFYLSYLGAEAYGLIGFFTVLQTWLQLLDVGISASLIREVARQRSPQENQLDYASGHLLRSMEFIFVPLSLLACFAIHTGAVWMANHWLNPRDIPAQDVATCISLMGLMVALRLLATLYKSGIQGKEQHGWLNAANVLIATIRYLGGLLLVSMWSQSPLDFFLFQVAVGVLETLIFAMKAYVLLPPPTLLSGFNWHRIKPIVPFAASMSFTSVLWIALTQLDKMVLSKVLLLKEYGYFSLVALISTGIITLANPLVQALLPRLTVLVAQNRTHEVQQLYLNASRAAASLLIPLSALIALHGYPLVLAWTGDETSAHWSQSILFWYALGSGLLALSGFQFYLQYAYGLLRLHIVYSLVSAAISIPVILLAAYGFGVYGTALAWFGLRAIAFVIWPPIVHGRFAPGIHKAWCTDIVQILIATILGLSISHVLFALLAPEGRLATFTVLGLSGLTTLLLVVGTGRDGLWRLYAHRVRPGV